MALVNKKFSDIITFSRASNATVTGSDGLIQYAPHNLLTYSQDFDNAAWTKARATVTANSLAAPDGTVTADKIVEDTTASNTHLVQETLTLATGLSLTVSVYAKAAERNWIRLQLNANASADGSAYFDLSTGEVGAIGGGTATITPVGNGWYRCTVSGTTTTINPIVRVNLANANNGQTYTGDGVSGVYVWGAQLSAGPRALSYTPTTSAAVYGPRFDYDPVSMAPKGLLVEEQRTNLATYSEQFDNAAWIKTATTVTANAVASPDGTVTADSLVVDTLTSVQGISAPTFTADGTSSYTASTYVKKGTGSGVEAILVFRAAIGSGTQYSSLTFNTVTGFVSFSLNGATSGTYTVQDVGGWWRVSITAGGIPAGVNRFNIRLISQPVGTTLDLWGAQLEAGAFATSYIPTVASQVTRSADVASVNTLSPWYNQTAGTLYAEASTFGDASVRYIANYNDNTTSNRLAQYFGASTFIGLVTTGGVSQANLSISGTLNVKHALAYAANDFITAANGTLSGADTSGTVPTVSQMNIGSGPSSASPINGHIRRIAYYPRRLTNSELQAITA